MHITNDSLKPVARRVRCADSCPPLTGIEGFTRQPAGLPSPRGQPLVAGKLIRLLAYDYLQWCVKILIKQQSKK